jgi:hypothetical protein
VNVRLSTSIKPFEDVRVTVRLFTSTKKKCRRCAHDPAELRVFGVRLHPSKSREESRQLDESYNVAISNEPISLVEAKKSPDWPEWEKAINAKLEQLQDMGTWELVKKPLDAIPIANKWLFVKKTNNIGQIEKYKARLVIKGCSQCPGFDFNETYSPVVRIETVQTILAMVPQMDLKIQQLDIKGAYLNGI